jgi:hypothetical protein
MRLVPLGCDRIREAADGIEKTPFIFTDGWGK